MNIAPITRFTSRSALKLKKNSPQILFYAGIVGTVATTVLASRATLKAVPVVERLKAEREELDSFHLEKKVELEVYNAEVRQQYARVAVDLGKLYGPTVLVGVGSLVALTKSHQQLTSRNTALTVAYTGLFRTFEAYRERVRQELSPEHDQKFLHGVVQQEIEYEDKNGKTKTKTIDVLDPSSEAALSYFYDSKCASFSPLPGYNVNFLEAQQIWANRRLRDQGHLFLNEVYDMLMIPHTRDGNILGWVYKDLGDNDTFVTFGYELDGEFLAGYKNEVMLNFNIHGPILGLI